jgi:hypothetical protein
MAYHAGLRQLGVALGDANTPKNTKRAYEPKQKEWKVNTPCVRRVIGDTNTCRQAWCARMYFPADKDYLPGDWVDEGKLFLFIKSEVAFRAPRNGARLKDEKKRKAAVQPNGKKRRKTTEGTGVEEMNREAEEETEAQTEEEDGDGGSPEVAVTLRMNSVKGYVSAIMNLWSQQVSMGLHASPCPRGDSIKNLLDSLEREQYQRSRAEFADRRKDTTKDGYITAQIPNVTKAVWAERKKRSIEAALRTQVDFLFGNAMFLRQDNRLELELADLFAMPLPKDGQDEKTWCLVAALLQGMILLRLSTPGCIFYSCSTNVLSREDQSARSDRVQSRAAPPGPPILRYRGPCRFFLLALDALRRALPSLPYQPGLVHDEGAQAGCRSSRSPAEPDDGVRLDAPNVS